MTVSQGWEPNRDLRRRTADDLYAEREALGFVRQPQVRWFEPGVLLDAAVRTAVSSAFGRFSDKRELQAEPQEIFDYSDRAEIGIDFLSDTGDGFDATYTMAWLLAQPEFEGPDGPLRRGDLLLLGGDQVYPAAGADAYRDRFVGPFAAALPAAGCAGAPDLFAIPGNHDWYDGLTSFLGIFCQPRSIGAWRTRQRRSYFALRLPHLWWLWGIDIQLDSDLDAPQKEYFERAAQQLREGDSVILLTAKPSWVKAEPGLLEPPSWRRLAAFEQRFIVDRGARLAVTLTGDLHHYSRYAPVEGEGPTRITAGGGGAYLSGTHTLPPQLELRPFGGGASTSYASGAVYPSREVSKRMRKGVLALALRNPGFGWLLGGVHTLLTALLLASLDLGAGSLLERGTAGGYLEFLAAASGGATVPVSLLLALALYAYADVRSSIGKLGLALLYAVPQLAAITALAYGLVELLPATTSGGLVWLAALPAAAAAGFGLGTALFAATLLTVHAALGAKAPKHANEVFAAQGIIDRKNLLRLHIGRDGALTVNALGVDRACREWDYVGDGSPGPWFRPAGEPPPARVIDGPMRFDPA